MHQPVRRAARVTPGGSWYSWPCNELMRGDTIFLVRVLWDPWLMKLHDLHGSTMNHASCHFWGWETVRLTEVQKSSLKSSQICTMVYYVYFDRKCWQHGFSTRNFSPSNFRIFQRLHWTLRSIRSDKKFFDQPRPMTWKEHDLIPVLSLAFRHFFFYPTWLEDLNIIFGYLWHVHLGSSWSNDEGFWGN